MAVMVLGRRRLNDAFLAVMVPSVGEFGWLLGLMYTVKVLSINTVVHIKRRFYKENVTFYLI